MSLPPIPMRTPPRSKAPVVIAASAAVLVFAGVAGWFAAQVPAPVVHITRSAPSASLAHPTAPPARVASVAKSASQLPSEPRFYALELPKPQPLPVTSTVPAAPAARASEILPAPPVALHAQISNALPDPALAAPISSVIPPLPDDSALLNETRDWKTKADYALAHRDRDTAIDLYRSAIPAAKLYLTRPGADSGGKAEIAELYRQLGTLQAIHASSAEARASYREGRRVLLSIRGGRGQWTEDCDRLYEAFEHELRSLSRD